MGLYKYYDPVTGTRKPIKSGSIVNMDGTNEYTPDEVKEMDDKITILSGVSGTKEKANKEDLETHKADGMTKAGGTFTGITTAYSNTSYTVRQIRNVILSTSNAVLSSMQDGDIWIKYK